MTVTLPTAHPLLLIDYRQRAGLNALEASKASRIGVTTLATAERGALAIMGGRLHALARVYGCKASDLVADDPKTLDKELAAYKRDCPPHRARITVQQWRADNAAE